MALRDDPIWPEVNTFIGAAITLCFYPGTVAAMGPASNGGILGLGSLVIAAGFAWVGFLWNNPNRTDRWILQLPIAGFITYVAFGDALTQFRYGWWWGF
jgi:hypothetical protein